jgi:serine/threonine-protein kinase
MSLTPGVRIGHYEILHLLGAGGMGEVYRARDTKLHRDVALKVLPRDIRIDPDRIMRFKREAQVLASLNHQHIGAIYGFEDSTDVHALVLELIEGPTLAECVQRRPMGIDEAMAIARQIAAALKAAHAKGIIHRDLKPANIKIAPGSIVKVLDFGLAKAAATHESESLTVTAGTRPGAVLGTFAYMSPEQARGAPVDRRTDIWAFGCILFELLTGRAPFARDTAADTIAGIVGREPNFAALPSWAPSHVRTLLRRCLQKNPERRPDDLTAELIHLDEEHAAGLESSIAVLPFANLSADKENQYFSDGLTEEIINLLARVPGVKVSARTSSFAFRGKEDDIRKIAQVLEVRTILEGSVRRSGSRIRVTVQLINAADGYQLWSERYDRELADVFRIQDDIAEAIAAALEAKLTAGSAKQNRYTPNLPAYDAFLKGQYSLARMTPDSLAHSLECFEKAIALDRDYAGAYVALATTLLLRANYGMQAAHDALPRARVAADKALKLDPSLPEAHVVLGVVGVLYDYDWDEADRHFTHAVARNPISPDVRAIYAGYYLLGLGRFDEAAAETEAALQQDPLNLLWRHHLTWSLLWSGRDADAAAEANRVLQIDDKYFLAHFDLSLVHFTRGRLVDAIACAERACAVAPWNDVLIGLLGGLLKLAGKRADDQIAKLRDAAANHEPTGCLVYHLVAGNIDEAADWSEKTIDERQPGLVYILRSPLAGALRASARWPALARRMNLP